MILQFLGWLFDIDEPTEEEINIYEEEENEDDD